LGGVIANNIHKKGWKIRKTIYIGAPLHGAYLLTQLESILPTYIRDVFYKPPYEILQNKDKENEPLILSVWGGGILNLMVVFIKMNLC